MPVKKNSSGRYQNYDPKTGRYAKANIIIRNEKIDANSVIAKIHSQKEMSIS